MQSSTSNLQSSSSSRRLQGIYRPLVAKAWQLHCTRLAMDPKDGVAYNAWYRQILNDCAGIKSTREATPEIMETLIAVFEDLIGNRNAVKLGWCVPRQQDFSDAQQAQFEKLVVKAWRKNVPDGTDPQDSSAFQQWMAGIMMSTPTPRNPRAQFEALMGRFAILANDEYWIRATAEAEERRMRYLIGAALADLAELTGEPHDWRYVQGIHAQARMASSLDDCPAEHLKRIFQALDTHRRRLRNRAEKPLEPAPF